MSRCFFFEILGEHFLKFFLIAVQNVQKMLLKVYHSEFFAKNRISTVFHCISTVFQYFRRTFNLKS